MALKPSPSIPQICIICINLPPTPSDFFFGTGGGGKEGKGNDFFTRFANLVGSAEPGLPREGGGGIEGYFDWYADIRLKSFFFSRSDVLVLYVSYTPFLAATSFTFSRVVASIFPGSRPSTLKTLRRTGSRRSELPTTSKSPPAATLMPVL